MTDKENIPKQENMFGEKESLPDENAAQSNGNGKSAAEEKNGEKTDDKPAIPEPVEDFETTSFEALFERLEKIVDKMEGGGLTLEESMKLYEEGVKKAEKLTIMLVDARKRVMKLVTDNDGESSLETFDGEETL